MSEPTAGIRAGLVWTYTALWIILVGSLASLKVWAFDVGAFDLGFFVHGLGSVARHGLAATIPFAGWSFLADHFSPLLIVFAPLATTMWGGLALVIVQAVVVGLSIPVVARIARDASMTYREQWLVIAGFSLHPAILYPVLSDVHANVMGIPFLVLAIHGIVKRSGFSWVAGAVGAALMREDLAVVVILLAVVFRRRLERKGRYAGVAVAGASLAAYGVLSQQSPHFFERYFYPYVALSDVGGSLGEAVGMLARDWVFLAGTWVVLMLPWVLIRRPAYRVVLLAVAVQLPFAFSVYLYTKTLIGQYYVMIPALMVGATALGVRYRAELDLPRLGAVMLLFAMGPIGINLLEPPARNNLLSIVGAVSDSAATRGAKREAVSCLGERTVASVSDSFVAWTGHVDQLYVYPYPFGEYLIGPIVFEAEAKREEILPTVLLLDKQRYRQILWMGPCQLGGVP